MDTKEIISSAAKNHHTVIMTAKNQNNSIYTREVEPYSYKFTNGNEILFCYDINKTGIRSFMVTNILDVEETDNKYDPRYPVEV